MPILAVAGLAVILLLFLFLLASPTFQKAIRDTYSGIPVIGGWLGDNNARLVAFLYGRLAVWAAQATGAVVQLFNTLADLAYLEAQQWTNFASSVFEAVFHIRTVAIPNAVAQAEAYGDRRLAGAQAILQAGIEAVRGRGESLYMAAISRMDREYVQATHYAQQTGLWAERAALQLWASATHYSQVLFVRAETDARAGEVRSEQYTAAQVAVSEDYTAQSFAVAVGYADQVGKVAEGYAEALTGRAIGRADAQNAQTLAFASAAAVALTAAIEAIERSPCMQRCSTLGQLGAELEALDALALVALIAEAGKDPQGFAREFEAEFGPVIQIVRDTLAGLGLPVGAAA